MPFDDATMEEWRPVSGYEGAYEVSSFGRVRSLARMVRGRSRNGMPSEFRVKGRVLIAVVNRYGYLACNLSCEGQRVNYEVHRLVCVGFHGKPSPDQQVGHIDGVRTNCRADNLRWVTASENMADKRRHGTHPSCGANPRAKLTQEAVEIVRSSALSGAELGRRFGVDRSSINRIRRGEGWNDDRTAA